MNNTIWTRFGLFVGMAALSTGCTRPPAAPTEVREPGGTGAPPPGASSTTPGAPATTPGAPATTAGSPGDLDVTNVRLPLADGRYSDPVTLAIRGGLIREVVRGDGPAEGPRVDAAGAFAIPGLVDAHLHISEPQVDLRALARGGNTRFIDLAADPGVASRPEAIAGEVELVGPLYTATGGHGTEMPGLTAVEVPAGAGGAEIDEIVSRTARPAWAVEPAGAKIVYDDMKYRPGDAGMPVLSRQQLGEVLDALVGAGRRRIHIHIGSGETWTRDIVEHAADVGLRRGPFYLVLEHCTGEGLDAAGVDRLRQSGVELAAVPTTVGILFRMSSGGAGPEIQQQVLPQLLGGVGSLAALGVPLFPGTDAGRVGDLQQEIQNLAQGIAGRLDDRETNRRLLLAATAPHRPSGELLEPGRVADLVILESDPFEDLQALSRVRMVIQGGNLIEGAAR